MSITITSFTSTQLQLANGNTSVTLTVTGVDLTAPAGGTAAAVQFFIDPNPELSFGGNATVDGGQVSFGDTPKTFTKSVTITNADTPVHTDWQTGYLKVEAAPVEDPTRVASRNIGITFR